MSQSQCSWYEFAQEIFRLAGVTTKLTPAGPNEFPAKVPRPKYSALENKALQNIKLDLMPHWRAALAKYLNQMQ